MPGSSARRIRIAGHVLVVAIVALAALLRLDAFVGKYGPLERPAWARIATHQVADVARELRPANVYWGREQAPYVGGDPINYLAYAREMTSFYQPHVREPVFLALTRAALWSLDGQDAGVSLASAVGSVLAVLATYLLGAALISPLAGLLASSILAIEYEAIIWAPDGWRDDTFTAMVLFAAWALLRLHQDPTFKHAVLAGVFCAAACLTRITALTFILPALVWIVVAATPERRRESLRQGAIALGVATLLVAPYLVSCAIATGDPFYAVNYHTVYYRHAEGSDISQPMSAASYLKQKFATRPAQTFDTGYIGLIVWPFITKWNGLGQWITGLGPAAQWVAVAGLAMLPFTRAGQLMLVILLTSLLPYAFTWNLGGGGEWRFTMHAYPFYIAAAGFAVAALVTPLIVAARARAWPAVLPSPRALARRTALVAVVAIGGTAAYFGLPWLVVKEAIGAGESTSIQTGSRDWIFYRTGWTPPRHDGIVARVSTMARSVVHVPLPASRAYDMTLRMDPIVPDVQQTVSVLFNRRLVGRLRLTWDPERVGTYRVHLPPEATHPGGNELVIIPEPMIQAASAGPRYAWIESDAQIGVRLWYVRILP